MLRAACRSLPAVSASSGSLIAALLVFGLPARRASVRNPDEARYMLVARDILEHGHWLIPDLRGRPYLNSHGSSSGPFALASLPDGEVTERTARTARCPVSCRPLPQPPCHYRPERRDSGQEGVRT